MNLADIVDTLASPPRRLPAQLDDAISYLASATGTQVYLRWTPAALARRYGSMKAAKAQQPDVFALLLDCPAVTQFWQAGELITLPADQAPPPGAVVERLLRTQRFRFRPASGDHCPSADASTVPLRQERRITTSALESFGNHPWLRRTGRFANHDRATNSLAVPDDGAAVMAFLAERTGRSPHTRRAYIAEIQRLIAWCHANRIGGPLSDLSRAELIQFRNSLPGTDSSPSAAVILGARSCTRAMAVVQSMYGYLLGTGYMTVNPAAELGQGATDRTGDRPRRFLPPAASAALDRWLDAAATSAPSLASVRRAAIVALYRWTGARLDELAHRDGYPRLRVDEDGWTLEVRGKGQKLREIPLPEACAPFIERYRVARGLPSVPSSAESLPLVQGRGGRPLGRSGLYAEVKAALREICSTLPATESASRSALQMASPHWLRHSYAHTLVVQQGVPLPVVQVLLGHASVQTAASYASTDLSEARRFVAQSFTLPKTGPS
ncbi:integrase [bacterium M00.F.Ca.ET.228.01.1.1]|nr:integrase [bacterium M00.F.Ca.ET.228.01.1.1]TGR95540.1 integrase [bacterium M00.F.Ca.ET.191.01.1.1]TGT96529.1 integrase [bacterium M00.F.Ca.ET.155.01.1.1]